MHRFLYLIKILSILIIEMKNISEFNDLKLEFKKIHELFLSGKFDIVIKKTKKIIKSNPNQIPFYNLLGLSYRGEKKFKLAEEIFRNALKIKPNDISILNNLGSTYRVLGEYPKSEKILNQALTINENDVSTLCNYANLKRDINKFDESIKYYEKAYKINNKIPTLIINLAGTYQIVGKFELSKNILEKFIEDYPYNAIAHKLLNTVIKYEENNKHQIKMLSVLKEKKFSEYDEATLLFSIAKSYEDQKNYKKSYEYFKKANNLQKKLIKNYSVSEEEQLFKKIKKIFKNTDFKKYPKNRENNDKLIFIIGLPRSGTTLTHQIVSAHSKVYGAGELFFLDQFMNNNINIDNFNSIFKEYLNINDDKVNEIAKEYFTKLSFINTDKKILLDKNPLNFQWVGFIKILFPSAKIIHCTRNLKDTALSIYKNAFDTNSLRWSNSEDDLYKYMSLYCDLMKFWEEKLPGFIYEINYQKLIENQKEQIKKLIEFCELNWEENCLNFNKISTPIKTVSLTQAREPIYKTSINSNKKYHSYLNFFKKIEKLEKNYQK